MELVPEHRALFGVDVVGSARNPGHHLGALSDAVEGMVRVALADSGIHRSEVTEWEHTGDGALLTLASRRLGTLLDLSTHLDELAAEHNHRHKPDVRLRIAVDLGPVADRAGLYAAKISHGRLLSASALKKVLERCLSERSDVHTGAIVSDDAFRCAFGGDHTRLVRREDFAEVQVSEKEFARPAWIRVPGFDARSVAEFAHQGAQADGGTTPEPSSHVHNYVGGNMYGVQAGTVTGGVNIGAVPR